MQLSQQAVSFFISNLEELSYYGLKPTPTGHLLVQQDMSNNLVLYESNFVEKFKFPGTVTDRAPVNFFRNPHFSFEGKKVIWFGGKSTLFTVDLRDMSVLKLENVIPQDLGGDDSRTQPLHCVADFEREKVLVSYFFEEEYVLSYIEKGREADIHILSEIFPKFDEITCMDLDKNKAFCFVGGVSVVDQRNQGLGVSRKGVVAAFSFNKDLKIVAQLELPTDKCSYVGSILVSPIHEDVIFVSTDGPLFILGLDTADKKLHVIKAINFNNKGKLNFELCLIT